MIRTNAPQAPKDFTAASFLSRPMSKIERDVWSTSSALAKDYLTEYGNELNGEHWRSLQALSSVFTAVTFGSVQGRFGVGAATGAGKTMSAVAFIVALHRHDRPESVAVCVEKVAQLVSFRNELIKWGVPEEKIGVWYSEGYVMPDGKPVAVPLLPPRVAPFPTQPNPWQIESRRHEHLPDAASLAVDLR
jgi:hypothetical protein